MRKTLIATSQAVMLAVAISANAEGVGTSFLEERDLLPDHHALVGVVFPTLVSMENNGLGLTFALKEAVRLRLDKVDEGPSGKRWVGFSTSYLTGAPMKKNNHFAAVELARLNGLQATVWGETVPYKYEEFDGFAVRSTFSYAGNYQDFRNATGLDLRLENWIVRNGETVVSVPVPSSRVELPPHLISAETFSDLSNEGMCFEFNGETDCVSFLEVGPTKIRSVEPRTGRISFTRFGRTGLYYANLPVEVMSQSESVAYVAMFLNYARGHWSNTVEEADSVLDGVNSTSTMVRDALLYKGAALYRSGRNGSGLFEEAKRIAPFSPEVGKYLIAEALLLNKSGLIPDSQLDAVIEDQAALIKDGWLEDNALN